MILIRVSGGQCRRENQVVHWTGWLKLRHGEIVILDRSTQPAERQVVGFHELSPRLVASPRLVEC